MDQPGITPYWLVAMRLMGAGLLLMLVTGAAKPKALKQIGGNRKTLLSVLSFGVFGVALSQLPFFTAVSTSNAPTATILQYLGPVFIMIYLAMRQRQLPRHVDLLSVLVAFVGIYLLVTHGNIHELAITPAGLFWGIVSGLASAVYTLMPLRLLERFDTQAVTAWAMFLGGLVMSPILLIAPWPTLTWQMWLGIAYVTVFGTLLAYLMYLQALNFLRPTTVGLLNLFEPLTATVIAITLFGQHVGAAEVLGGIMVISTTFLQAWPDRRADELEELN